MFRAIARMFDYSGRSTRWEYWSFLIGFIVVLVITGAGVASYQQTHLGLEPHPDDTTAGLAALAFLALVAAPHLALKVRRYHDFGWSGWAVLWVFVPLVNLFMEFMLLFRGPTAGPVYAGHDAPQVTIYNAPGGAAAYPGPAANTHVDQISRLADMHAQGVLSADEFAAAKARVLRS